MIKDFLCKLCAESKPLLCVYILILASYDVSMQFLKGSGKTTYQDFLGYSVFGAICGQRSVGANDEQAKETVKRLFYPFMIKAYNNLGNSFFSTYGVEKITLDY